MNSKRERIIRARCSHRNWLAGFDGGGSRFEIDRTCSGIERGKSRELNSNSCMCFVPVNFWEIQTERRTAREFVASTFAREFARANGSSDKLISKICKI